MRQASAGQPIYRLPVADKGHQPVGKPLLDLGFVIDGKLIGHLHQIQFIFYTTLTRMKPAHYIDSLLLLSYVAH